MSEAEQYWDKRAAKLRRLMGFRPLTPEEAEEALRKVKNRQPSEDDIETLVDAISRGEIPIPEERKDDPQSGWTPEEDFEAMELDAVLFKNEGESSPESDKLEEELLEELLNDDEKKDTNGLEE